VAPKALVEIEVEVEAPWDIPPPVGIEVLCTPPAAAPTDTYNSIIMREMRQSLNGEQVTRVRGGIVICHLWSSG
jgi:hypothetical protein